MSLITVFVLKSIFPDVSIFTLGFLLLLLLFWLPFAWWMFVHPFTFSLDASLGLTGVSYRVLCFVLFCFVLRERAWEGQREGKRES